MNEYGWELHQEPYRHYKRFDADKNKWTWEGRDRQRIASVTTVLGGSTSLTGWAANNALVAAERASVQWLGAGPPLAKSLLPFGTLAQLTGLMPDSIRDDKGAIGTMAHTYLSAQLIHSSHSPEDFTDLPYGIRTAIDRFLYETGFLPVYDAQGARVERAVGDEVLATAGTYDAQGEPQTFAQLNAGVHRIDAKTSNTVQAKHFAQLAIYERLAQAVGESPSEWLTIIHLTPLGEWVPYSIAANSVEATLALNTFYAYLAIYRGENTLAKLLKKEA